MKQIRNNQFKRAAPSLNILHAETYGIYISMNDADIPYILHTEDRVKQRRSFDTDGIWYRFACPIKPVSKIVN